MTDKKIRGGQQLYSGANHHGKRTRGIAQPDKMSAGMTTMMIVMTVGVGAMFRVRRIKQLAMGSEIRSMRVKGPRCRQSHQRQNDYGGYESFECQKPESP